MVKGRPRWTCFAFLEIDANSYRTWVVVVKIEKATVPQFNMRQVPDNERRGMNFKGNKKGSRK